MGYSLRMFGAMQADEVRIGGYNAALEAVMTPGCRVVDIGAGPGIMTLMACQLGAGHVDAVEIDDTIHLARELVARNGFADRVACHQTMSTTIALPQRADVVLADLRAALPFHGAGITSMIDARDRLLAAEGHLIPRRDWLRGAVVSAPREYGRLVDPWERGPFGLDLTAGRPFAVQHWQRVTLPPDALLSDPSTMTELDYTTVATPNLATSASWTISVPGTAHGLALWFRTELVDGIGYETGPQDAPTVYGQAFFPWERPLAAEPGDRVDVEVRADLIDGSYTWTWRSRVQNGAGSTVRFEQSTFGARPLTAAMVRARAADARPRLGREGRTLQRILSLLDGDRSLQDIAHLLAADAEGLTPAVALRRAADVAERYGESSEP